MPKHAVEVGWKPREWNTLWGFATINVQQLRLVVHDIAFHGRNRKRWAQPPSKPMVVDGQLAHGSGSRIRYVPILEFSDREKASAFSQACWQALDSYQQL